MSGRITSHSEALPRVLEVQRFVAAREIEVGALCKALEAAEDIKYGLEALPRHLRRRATSHNSYHHRRRPRQLKPSQAGQQQLGGHGDVAGTPPVAVEEKAVGESRAMRRRPGRLQAAAEASCAQDLCGRGPEAAPRRLETHVWHAKRFAMHVRWGHSLAEGAPGRGRGSRSLLHSLHTGALLHDASYLCPVQLSGSHNAVSALLASLGADAGPGDHEHTALLRRPGSHAEPLAVARILRLPVSSRTSVVAAASPCTPAADNAAGAAPEEPPSVGASEQWACWIHPECYLEALLLLRVQCEQHGVQLGSRAAHWRRLELRGPRSEATLRALLGRAQAAHLEAASAEGSVVALQLPDPRLVLSRGSEGVEAGAGAGQASACTLSSSPVHHLWMEPETTAGPLSEHQVGEQRRLQRLESVGLGSQVEPGSALQRAGHRQAASGTAECAESCPLLLVRRRLHGVACGGWSLVLPAQWVSPIWMALVFAGARATGLREWHWAATDQGHAFYPDDFRVSVVEVQEKVQKRKRRRRKAAPDGTHQPDTSDAAAIGVEVTQGDTSSDRQVIAPDGALEHEASGGAAMEVDTSPGAAAAAAAAREQTLAAEGLPPCDAPRVAVVEAGASSRAPAPVQLPLSAQAGYRPQDCGAGGLPAAAQLHMAQQLSTVDLVRVHVRMWQRGVALKGAVLRSPGPDPGAEAAMAAPAEIVGCITSELPRGAGLWAGASGLCSATALEKLRSQQQEQGADASEAGIRVALRNPGSSALRFAIVTLFTAMRGSNQIWL